jgi:hypothetical protein
MATMLRISPLAVLDGADDRDENALYEALLGGPAGRNLAPPKARSPSLFRKPATAASPPSVRRFAADPAPACVGV